MSLCEAQHLKRAALVYQQGVTELSKMRKRNCQDQPLIVPSDGYPAVRDAVPDKIKADHLLITRHTVARAHPQPEGRG